MNFLKGPAPRIIVSLSSVGLIVYLLRDTLGESMHILRHGVSWHWFIVSLAGYVLVQIIMAYRLFRIFLIKGLNIGYGETLYLCIVGLFFNLFLPSAVGGDVAKIYFASKRSGKKVEATTAIIVDRLTGFIAIMTIALVSVVFFGNRVPNDAIKYAVYGFIGLMLVTVAMFSSRRLSSPLRKMRVFLPSQKLRDKVAELYQAIYSCKKNWPVLAGCILLSIAGQSIIIYMYHWLSLSLGTFVDPAVFFLGIPIVTIISMAPSLGGLGVREGGTFLIFSPYMTSEMLGALCVLVDLIIYGFGLAGGLVFALGGGLKNSSLRDIEKAS